ncbi:hypothetical protein, partial [Mesorhizobium sp. M7A.F.Ca.CA.004.04.2.1]|uniref:hypothetical protein n=1 Tax=Mesorhizobium sp. M7A.F.Ca.CA.004.04.2.1 TaxID=2496677 RepID=UPI0019D482B7
MTVREKKHKKAARVPGTALVIDSNYPFLRKGSTVAGPAPSQGAHDQLSRPAKFIKPYRKTFRACQNGAE